MKVQKREIFENEINWFLDTAPARMSFIFVCSFKIFASHFLSYVPQGDNSKFKHIESWFLNIAFPLNILYYYVKFQDNPFNTEVVLRINSS